MIRDTKLPLKVLGEGELTKKFTVTAAKFSAQRTQKIEAAGGTAPNGRADRSGMMTAVSDSDSHQSGTGTHSMLQGFLNIFRIADLRNKVFFTLSMLVIYRIGFWIPLIGVDQSQLAETREDGHGRPDPVSPESHSSRPSSPAAP